MNNCKYLKYLVKHKWHVAKQCFRYGLYWQGLVHDWNKFLPSEWIPYRNFFNTPRTKETKLAFDYAWLKHQNRAPHHWQYWLLQPDKGVPKALPIPRKYVLEMVADWVGASIAIVGDNRVSAWYEENKENMILNPATRLEVEQLLHGFDPLTYPQYDTGTKPN